MIKTPDKSNQMVYVIETKEYTTSAVLFDSPTVQDALDMLANVPTKEDYTYSLIVGHYIGLMPTNEFYTHEYMHVEDNNTVLTEEEERDLKGTT